MWDTPGFGDSARLARRMKQQGNPIGWFLSQVWDRFRDRAFFLSQQVVRNVRDQADIVLYLANASESPQDAGYLAAELAILEWIGKPVIVLINQTGRPRPRDEEQAEEALWRAALASHSFIRAVTTFDAFARCWVQEIVLFDLVGSRSSGSAPTRRGDASSTRGRHGVWPSSTKRCRHSPPRSPRRPAIANRFRKAAPPTRCAGSAAASV